MEPAPVPPADPAPTLLDERLRAGTDFFESEAPRIARLCHRMAERFARGGRLLALGATPQARSDARHVAVEFVHPVIVGKRALPALALIDDAPALAGRLALTARADDMVVVFGLDDVHRDADDRAPEAGQGAGLGAGLAAALALARERGCLTVGFPREAAAPPGVAAPGVAPEPGAEWTFDPPSADPFVRQELVETLYHVLWELVHVFFEHRGLLEGRPERRRSDPGASSFLYPFLEEREHDLDAVLDDVARSVLLKARDVGELRRATLERSGHALRDAAATLRETFAAGRTVLALGNGGSATDAMDLVADLRSPPRPGRRPRPALDLTDDAAILTAVGNDVGIEQVFARQVIAWGSEGDALVAFSTSGGSRNVARALAEARRRGLRTIAFVGYDGGAIAQEGLADHVIVSPSEHVPRIQEAQATAYHLLVDLLEEGA